VREGAVAVLVEVGAAAGAHELELVVAPVRQHDVAQEPAVGVLLLASGREAQAQARGSLEERLGPERRLFAEDRLRLAARGGLAGVEALLRVDAQEPQPDALARAPHDERVAIDDLLERGLLAHGESGRGSLSREQGEKGERGEHAAR
jgi:hypothetical protein